MDMLLSVLCRISHSHRKTDVADHSTLRNSRKILLGLYKGVAHPAFAMVPCKLCGIRTEEVEGVKQCTECGYEFVKGIVTDFDKLLTYYNTSQLPWPKEVRFKRRLLKIQKTSQQELADLLGQSKSKIQSDLQLADGLEEYPYLEQYPNKTKAIRHLKELRSGMADVRQLPEDEREIQLYLRDNWASTCFGKFWRLVAEGTRPDGQYPAGDCGFIDLLAKAYFGDKWLIVELKRNNASDDTVGQLLRYMGWVKENLADEAHEVHGLILASAPNEHARLASLCVPNTSLLVYRKKGKQWEFLKPEIAALNNLISRLSPEELDDLKKHYQ